VRREKKEKKGKNDIVKRKNKYLRIQAISSVLYLQLPVFLPDQLKLLVPIHLTILKKVVIRRLSVVGVGLKIIKKKNKEKRG
jgi:hypothetical protein